MDIKGIISSAGATIFCFGTTLIVGIAFGGFIFNAVLGINRGKNIGDVGDGTYILAIVIYSFWVIIVLAIAMFLATQIFV